MLGKKTLGAGSVPVETFNGVEVRVGCKLWYTNSSNCIYRRCCMCCIVMLDQESPYTVAKKLDTCNCRKCHCIIQH